MEMKNNANATTVIKRYKEQTSALHHEVLLLNVLREEDAQEIQQLREENRRLEQRLAEYEAQEAQEAQAPEAVEAELV